MPGSGVAQGAASSAWRSRGWRARSSALVAERRACYLLGVATLAALYVGTAQLGYELQFAGPVAAIVWLPVGVGIAFLYLGDCATGPGS